MSFEITTRAVGSVVGRAQVDVNFRMTSAYAAAIGADADRYLDDGVPGGAVAPPAFSVVLEWPLLLRQPFIGMLGVPDSAGHANYFGVLLHAFQDLHVHRLIRPGDRLHVLAKLAEVKPTAAGALAVCRVETACARTGEPVTTSWIGALFRGCGVEGPAVSVATAPPLGDAEGPGVDAEIEQIPLSRALPFLYTECSGHWNPIHTERAFARAAGYADLVVHGTATWAIACQRLIDRHAGGDPHRLARFAARFSHPLFPGEPVRVHQAAKTAGLVAFEVHNTQGQAVLSRGMAEFKAD